MAPVLSKKGQTPTKITKKHLHLYGEYNVWVCIYLCISVKLSIVNVYYRFDYGEKFWIIKWKQFTCTCGSQKCRYSTETIQKTLTEYRQRHEIEAEDVAE